MFSLVCLKDNEAIWFAQMLVFKVRLYCRVLLREKRLSPTSLQNKLYLFSLALLAWSDLGADVSERPGKIVRLH